MTCASALNMSIQLALSSWVEVSGLNLMYLYTSHLV